VGEMRADAPFDFGDRAFIPLLREEGWAIAQDKGSGTLSSTQQTWHQAWRRTPGTTAWLQR